MGTRRGFPGAEEGGGGGRRPATQKLRVDLGASTQRRRRKEEGLGGGAAGAPPGTGSTFQSARPRPLMVPPPMTGASGYSRGARTAGTTAQGARGKGKQWYSFLKMIRANPESMEFVYLTTQEGEGTYNPYDLKIVSHGEMDPNRFYTMSSSGVTQVLDGQSEFTPLAQWEREYHLFNQIITLNVFRQFRLWKGFATWKRFVRQHKLRYCRNKLEKHLFYLNPIFQSSLLEIRRECHDISNSCMHDLQKGTLYTLDVFVKAQKEQSEVVKESLQRLSERTSALVMSACVDALEAMESNIFKQPAEDTNALTGLTRDTGMSTKKEEEFSYAITAARRSEQRKLLNFIRLVDYMICDTLQMLLTKSISGMLDALEYRGDLEEEEEQVEELGPQPPVFEVEIILSTDDGDVGLHFEPSPEQFEDQTEAVINSFLSTIGSIQRLLTSSEVTEFLDSISTRARGPSRS